MLENTPNRIETLISNPVLDILIIIYTKNLLFFRWYLEGDFPQIAISIPDGHGNLYFIRKTSLRSIPEFAVATIVD